MNTFWRPSVIETKNLLIRAIKETDSNAIYSYCKNPDVSKYTLWEPHQNINDAEEFIKNYVFNFYKKGEPEAFAICLKENPELLIGTVGCFWVSKNNQVMELAYALNSQFWGQGIMAEASQAVLNYVFRTFKVAKIQCRCKEENYPSYRVMEKIGMIYEGTLRNQIYHRNKFWNMKYYSLLFDEWLNIQRLKKDTFIRRAKEGDERGIHDARMKSIREICSSDYTPHQIAAWGGREYRFELRNKAIKEDHIWVIESNQKIEGFGHLFLEKEKNYAEVMGLYLTPAVKSQGHGRAIIHCMKELAKSMAFPEIFLSSTKTSKQFYEKQGFIQYAADDSRTIGGVAIEGHPMKCKL